MPIQEPPGNLSLDRSKSLSPHDFDRVNVRPPAFVLHAVPKGRPNVAHRTCPGRSECGSREARGAIVDSPEGAAHVVRPVPALRGLAHCRTQTHRWRSGLRSSVPDGTGQDDKSDSSFGGTDSEVWHLGTRMLRLCSFEPSARQLQMQHSSCIHNPIL